MERASTEYNNESWGGINYGPDVHNERISGTMDLGLYYNPTKKQMQVAKIPLSDRTLSEYVIGAPGSGKTHYLESKIIQDIIHGNGFAVIDPHSDLIRDILGLMACYCYEHNKIEEMSERVILIDPTDAHSTIVFNPIEAIPGVSVTEQASELISSFRKIWADSWGSRLETILRNSLIALGEAELTLCELMPFLTRRSFRAAVLQNIANYSVIEYFRHFDTMTDRAQATCTDPILNKIDAFMSDERIRQIFSSPKSSFNLRRIMDEKKILLINLDKGRLRGSSELIGSLLLTKLQMAAFSRSDIPPSQRVPFYTYIDEFQNYATDSFEVVLSEARKYNLSFILAHQNLSQIPDRLRDLIFSCAGLQSYFRVNRSDASHLAKEVFQYSDYEVRSKGRESVPWNWERKISYLQNLDPRTFLAKHKIQGGTLELRTIEIPKPWEMMGVTQAFYSDYLSTIPFGKHYLRSREELQAQSIERLRAIQHVDKPETHTEKSASAPAPTTRVRPIEHEISEEPIILPSTFDAVSMPPKSDPTFEREHRRLQHLIKQLGEKCGYKATIEQPTIDGQGRVDVGLEQDGRRIACEICVTTPPEHELQNIRKCLASDYDRVVLCSPDKKALYKVMELGTTKLTESERQQVLFLDPDELILFFEEEAANAAGTVDKVKGYKVKVNFQPQSEAEKKSKRQAVAQVVLGSFQRDKQKQ